MTLNHQNAPHMSDNTVKLILNTIKLLPSPKTVVEYGSGNSTLFFLDYLLNNNISCDFISVEVSPDWFRQVIDNLNNICGNILSEKKFDIYYWKLNKYLKYIFSQTHSSLKVPVELCRYSDAKRRIKSDLPSFLIKKLLRSPNSPYVDGYFNCSLNKKIQFSYLLKSDLFKDQYGESPLKNDYIDAGILPVAEKAEKGSHVSAVFIIDGGPRVDIVSRILDLEGKYSNISIAIFLLEAQRLFYENVISRRPAGKIIEGSNKMLNGDQVYKIKKATSDKNKIKHKFWYGQIDPYTSDLARRELWLYKNF